MLELIPGVMQVARVNQFCPSCEKVELVAIMKLTDSQAYLAWCPCGAVFNQDKVLTPHNND